MARHLNPSVRIVVRTRYVLSIDELMRLGATEVVVEEFEASLELFARVLEFYETPNERVPSRVGARSKRALWTFRAVARPDIKLDALRHLGIHAAAERLSKVEISAIRADPRGLERLVSSRQETNSLSPGHA